nr:MAG TPA: hypothetical protein [Caudoviricetes sp.]
MISLRSLCREDMATSSYIRIPQISHIDNNKNG